MIHKLIQMTLFALLVVAHKQIEETPEISAQPVKTSEQHDASFSHLE